MFELVHIYETAFWWIGILSIATFVGTLIVIPILVIHIPVDYFNREKQNPGSCLGQYPLIRLPFLVFKNIIGIIFVLAGFAMLFLPGQGLITILIGIMMLNFPGKFALERRIVRQPNVLHAINWMRAKANKPAIQTPKLNLTTGQDSAEKD